MRRLPAFGICLSLFLAACGGSAAPATSLAAPASSAAPAASASAPGASAAAGAAGGSTQAAANPFASGIQPLAQRIKIRTSISKQNIILFPMMVMIENGSLAKAGFDLDNSDFQNPLVTMQQFAHGDIDVSTFGVSPALFNQASQGLGGKIVASEGIAKQGRIQTDWMVVEKDQADKIKDLKDLKGKAIDAAAPGTPLDLLVRSALEQGGLDPAKDVTLTYKARGFADMLAMAKTHGADVIGMTEPLASQTEQQGLTVRWKSDFDINPWYQPGTIAFTESFLSKNRAAAEKWVELYLAACRQINAANGVWTDDLLNIAVKWTGLDAASIKAAGGPPYYDPNGAVSMDSLTKAQDFFTKTGDVKQKVDVNTLVDKSLLDDAVKTLGPA